MFNIIVGNMPPHCIPGVLKNGINIPVEYLKDWEYVLPHEEEGNILFNVELTYSRLSLAPVVTSQFLAGAEDRCPYMHLKR
jgi:hypothetical protein